MNEQKINFNYAVNLTQVLKQLKSTIVMSTYQSGKLMIIGQYQNALDIRYKNFPRPMGMYAKNNKIWAGLGHGIWEFHNFKDAYKKESYDACYLPTSVHFTGDIDIHEMEYCKDELYFINTKFSCLCLNDTSYSFKPIWKPKFISILQPTDKCHLNGFCTRDGEPRYVTALGTGDKPLNWRKNKATGGVLIDIKTDKTLVKGLCMPHSPRWYQEKLWFLESGKGSLSYFDLSSRKIVEIAKVPGFTRGIHFVGDLAFIGVSKVRESATFSGLPVTKLAKRVCGIWVVNIKSGEIVSFIEFTEGIDEIFAISVLPHQHMELFNQENELSHINYLIHPQDVDFVKMPETAIEMATPHFDKGNDLYTANKKEEAIIEFQKALDIQPDYLPATFNIAIALGDLDRFDEAEKILLDVIEKDASIAESYNSLGYLYYKNADFQSAKKSFLKAIEINPKYDQAKNSLQVLEREMDKDE
jgi:uncharacterized protein (TIGR03032 family)